MLIVMTNNYVENLPLVFRLACNLIEIIPILSVSRAYLYRWYFFNSLVEDTYISDISTNIHKDINLSMQGND